MARSKVGKPDVAPDAPRTRPASSRATRRATTRSSGPPARTGTSTAERSTGVNAEAREPDRPADAEPLAGARRAAMRRGAASARPVPELGLRGRGAARSSTRRRRRCASAARSTSRAARRSGRCCSTSDPDRRPPARLRRGRAGAAVRAVRPPEALGHARCARLPWTRTTLGRAGVRRTRPWSTCRSRAPTTSRSPRRSTSTRWRDGEVPLELLFSGTVFYAGAERAAADDADPGSRRPSTGCRCACGARRWSATSPAARGCGCARETLRPARRVQGAPRAAELGATPSTRCSTEEG